MMRHEIEVLPGCVEWVYDDPAARQKRMNQHGEKLQRELRNLRRRPEDPDRLVPVRERLARMSAHVEHAVAKAQIA